MTAVAEHVLDTALRWRTRQWGKLCPPMLSCLDELPSTAPLPTLAHPDGQRAGARDCRSSGRPKPGRQLDTIFGEQQARALFGLTNVLIMFGGSKDVAFNKEVSDLVGPVRVARTTWNRRQGWAAASGDDIAIITTDEVRQIPEKQALVVAENSTPMIAKLDALHRRQDRTPTAGRTDATRTIVERAQLTRSPPRPGHSTPSPTPAAAHSPRRPTTMVGTGQVPGADVPDPQHPTVAGPTTTCTSPRGHRPAEGDLGNPALLPRPWDPATYRPATALRNVGVARRRRRLVQPRVRVEPATPASSRPAGPSTPTSSTRSPCSRTNAGVPASRPPATCSRTGVFPKKWRRCLCREFVDVSES